MSSANTKRSGLGRGIDSLLAADFDRKVLLDVNEQVNNVNWEDIEPNQDQPRKVFEATALKDLADSIKQHGIVQPLVITPKENSNKYEIIAGERRWRAAKIAGLKTVPALIRTAQENEKLELALIENVQRVDLSPLEQAISIARLHEQFNLSYSEIAKRLGKAETTLSNIVRLLQLPADARTALEEGRITEGHARAILSLKHDKGLQQRLRFLIESQGWSVRKAEQFVTAQKQGLGSKQAITKRVATQTPETDKLGSKLGVKVSVYHTARGGRLELHFKNDQELNEIYKKLDEI